MESDLPIKPSSFLLYVVFSFLYFLKKIHHIDDLGRNTCYARSHDFGDEGRARSQIVLFESEFAYHSGIFLQTVAKIMSNPFALGGIVGDGKRPEDSDKALNKIELYPEFEVGGYSVLMLT